MNGGKYLEDELAHLHDRLFHILSYCAVQGEKMQNSFASGSRPTRRAVLMAATAAAATVSTPALAQRCEIGPPKHDKGPPVFLDYDQIELDAVYQQERYEPMLRRVQGRMAANSHAAITRLGMPERVAYGDAEIEQIDIYRTERANAPIFVFIHGGTWRFETAPDQAYAAETFIRAGAHYLAANCATSRLEHALGLLLWRNPDDDACLPLYGRCRKSHPWLRDRPGLLAFYSGQPLPNSNDRTRCMVQIWKSLAAIEAAIGDGWDQPPKLSEGVREFIVSARVEHCELADEFTAT
jgi:hypothetical protein